MLEIPQVKKTELDIEAISKFASEHDFVGVAVDLMIEAGSHVCIAACALPYPAKAWNVDEAVLGGHLVRLYKLLSGLLDQTCQRRRETTFILARLAFECIVNLRYLVKFYDVELLNSYKSYSLQHEKKLLNRIELNIEAHDGDELPIETRMKNSISRAFSRSNLTPEDIPGKKIQNWGNKNLFEKAEAIGLDQAYLAMFGGGSHHIHGNWQDLLDHHLDFTEDGLFTPNLEWSQPRPQLLTTMAILSAEAVKEYIQWTKYPELSEHISILDNFIERVILFDRMHEEWLQKA